jgi:hypothetical protein
MPSSRLLLRMCIASLLTQGGAIAPPAATAQAPASSVAARLKPFTYVAPSRQSYMKFAIETETMLRQDVLGVWFPRRALLNVTERLQKLAEAAAQ